MDEEKETKGEEQRVPTVDIAAGYKPEEIDLIKQANDDAERLEKANERLEKAQTKHESLKTKKLLGGKAKAPEQESKTVEEDPIAYTERMTGIKLR